MHMQISILRLMYCLFSQITEVCPYQQMRTTLSIKLKYISFLQICIIFYVCFPNMFGEFGVNIGLIKGSSAILHAS